MLFAVNSTIHRQSLEGSGESSVARNEEQSKPEAGSCDEGVASEAETILPSPNASHNSDAADAENPGEPVPQKEIIKLYKSSRLKGYITLFLASFINYDASQKSSDVISSIAVPSTSQQRRYSVAVSVVSLVVSGAALLSHLDRITPLEKVWISAFKSKSRFELFLALFLVLWWSIAVGIETTVKGIAGDGKEQYSLYYSAWTCCFSSYWILERWWVECGLASFKSFITSWPYRAPGWLCILFLNAFTFAWYMDLWRNHSGLDDGRLASILIYRQFDEVKDGLWQFLIIMTVFTFVPSLAFVLAEIFRETKPDGSNEEKSRAENTAEGVSLLLLVVGWVPAIMMATTPGGPASLVGNAYFFSWFLAIFIAETAVWFVHDLRQAIHKSLRERNAEYQEKQRQVLERARTIQQLKEEEETRSNRNIRLERASTEFFDAVDE